MARRTSFLQPFSRACRSPGRSEIDFDRLQGRPTPGYVSAFIGLLLVWPGPLRSILGQQAVHRVRLADPKLLADRSVFVWTNNARQDPVFIQPPLNEILGL